MKVPILLLVCIMALRLAAQNDSTRHADTTAKMSDEALKKKKGSYNESGMKVFYGQRLINAKTVEVLKPGAMAFTVIHTFGDIAGDKGGTKNFFGLDEAADAQIGFQLGLVKHLNIALQHTVGGGDGIFHFYELGVKYQFLNQEENKPVSLTAYVNLVSTGQKGSSRDSLENSFHGQSDRYSELAQLMIARRIGTVSLQVSGTFLHTNLVIPGDQNDLFAIGAAIRIPLGKKLFLISDYFHAFRSQESTDAWKNYPFIPNQTPRDVFGVGLEILTFGHVFHLNFTNARNILENRSLPRTTDSWGNGEFRWGFTLTRNFTVFRPKSQTLIRNAPGHTPA